LPPVDRRLRLCLGPPPRGSRTFAHLTDGADTNEKRLIGELWERQSQGRGLFVVVEKAVAGKDMRGQMMNKFRA
jgi:hypothetical protein